MKLLFYLVFYKYICFKKIITINKEIHLIFIIIFYDIIFEIVITIFIFKNK